MEESMLGIVFGLLSGAFSWIKVALSFATDLIKSFISGCFDLLKTKPGLFFSIVFALLALIMGYMFFTTKSELDTAKQEIITLTTSNKNLQSALDKEKITLQNTIKINNAAVASLKSTADDALASAQKAMLDSQLTRQKYQNLVAKYSKPNPNTGTAEQRIEREEKTTDQFIGDWSDK
jgi:uncharacterized membrane protein YcgQ (UPF0703/DUF1980 family)